MQPLVPVPRQDKTGKIVVRHMKANPSSPLKMAAIPAPVTASPKKKKPAKKPLARQLEPESRSTRRSSYSPDPDFCRAVGLKGTEWDLISFRHSDMEMFSVLSVVSPDEAVVAFEQKYCADFSVMEVLHENGLGHLEVDRREMMQEAMERRLNPLKIIEMHAAYGINNYDAKVFLDACKVREATKCDLVPGTTSKLIHEAILSGDIAYDDLMEIEILRIKHSGSTERIIDALKGIHAGTARYDLGTLKKFAQQSSNPHQFRAYEELLDDLGYDFIKDVKFLAFAIDINKKFSGRDLEYRRELISYAESGSPSSWGNTPEDLARLHSEGIPAKEGARLLNEYRDIERVIAVLRDGIPHSVSDGWL